MVFGKTVRDLQENVIVSEDAITGTLKYVTEYTGFSSTPDLQEGNYLVVNLANNNFSNFTSVKIGLDPTQGSGLVEIINDPDKNGVFRIANTSQKFKIVSISVDGVENTQIFDLSGLTLES
jgi:hypothetical protein